MYVLVSQWFGLLFQNLCPDLLKEILRDLTAKEIRNLLTSCKAFHQICKIPTIQEFIWVKRTRWNIVNEIIDMNPNPHTSWLHGELSDEITKFVQSNPQRFPNIVSVPTKETFTNLVDIAETCKTNSNSACVQGYQEYLCFCDDEIVLTQFNKLLVDKVDNISWELQSEYVLSRSTPPSSLVVLGLSSHPLSSQKILSILVKQKESDDWYFGPIHTYKNQVEYFEIQVKDEIKSNMITRFGVPTPYSQSHIREFILINTEKFVSRLNEMMNGVQDPTDDDYDETFSGEQLRQIEKLIEPSLRKSKTILNLKVVKVENMFEVLKVTPNVFAKFRHKVLDYNRSPTKEEVYLFFNTLDDLFLTSSQDFLSKRSLTGSYLISIKCIPLQLRKVWFESVQSQIIECMSR